MAIERMKMVSIIGKFKSLDATIEAYLDSGCFQPEAASQYVANVKGFTNLNEENPYGQYLNKLTTIIENSGLVPKIVDDAGKTAPLPEIDEAMKRIDERVGSLLNQRERIKAEIEACNEQAAALAHFTELDVSIKDAFDSKYVKFRFGKLPNESFDKLKFYKSNPYIVFYPCSTEDVCTWGMYVAPAQQSAEVDNIFNSLFFERLRIPDFDGTPKEAIDSLKMKKAELVAKQTELNEIISEFTSLEKEEYFKLYTQLKRSYEACEIRKYATRYGDSFVLVGWIPERDTEKFEGYMNKVDAIEFSYSNPDENTTIAPPIKLKNPKIFKPFEYYVKMFGVPAYDEIDPTPFMAIVYTVLFGIMFPDLGQGIVLAIVGYLMYKLKKMDLGLILVPCGIAGAIGGLVFGSVFGFEHLLDPMYTALGFDGKPIEVMHSVNTILVAAIAIGVALVMVAMMLNIYCCIKRRQFGQALFSENGLCGLLIYASIIVLLLTVIRVISSSVVLSAVTIAVLCVSLILVMFKEPLITRMDKKEKFKPEGSTAEYVMQSFFELFEAVISYITNTVSFLRVGAFVIVHVGMMTVFFTLAEMMPNVVLYWVMVVFGNVFVLAIEGLLVGVQSLRLLFYEMFSRFYSGEGKPYEPAKIGQKSEK